VKKRQRSFFLQTVAIAFIIAYIVGSSIAMTVMLYSVLHTQRSLEDCIVPDGQCKKEGETATGEAIESLNKASDARAKETREYTIASNWCEQFPEIRTYQVFHSCVVRHVEDITGD